jgi:hypothetical protein
MRGRQRLRDVDELQLDFDHCGKWKHALASLSDKPAAEWSQVAVVLKAELVAGKRRYLTPQSIVDHWHVYSRGEAPGSQTPRTGGSRVATDEEYAAAAAKGEAQW